MIKDIRFAIDKLGLDDDMLIIVGDNILDFSLTKFINYSCEKQTSCIMRYYETGCKKLLRCGVVSIDENDKILNMTEKSHTSTTPLVLPSSYYYTKSDAKLVQAEIEAGYGTDALGNYIAWLCCQRAVQAL